MVVSAGRTASKLWGRSIIALGALLLSACAQAQPSTSSGRAMAPTTLSPEAQQLINEAADLLFGDANTAPPLIDVANMSRGGAGGSDGACRNFSATRNSSSLYPRDSYIYIYIYSVYCSENTVLDGYWHEKGSRPYFTVMSFQFIDDLSRTPSFRYPAERYAEGYFADSGEHCQLWLQRNEAGWIEFAALRIRSHGSALFSMDNHEQQECFIRGTLVAQGLQGGATLPFERLAYRAPFPPHFSWARASMEGPPQGFRWNSVSMSSYMRRHIETLIDATFILRGNDNFAQVMLNGPIERSEFVGMLAANPYIEQQARWMAEVLELEARERAMTGPSEETRLEAMCQREGYAPPACLPLIPRTAHYGPPTAQPPAAISPSPQPSTP